METKKIFLASSSQLEDDRQQFEIFINRKNKEWTAKGVFLELVIWEDFLDAISPTRLQDEYNKAIKQCDIFVMLFSTKVGKYTAEEFDTAFKQFKTTGKPLIYTYFKDAETGTAGTNNRDITSLRAFQKKLHDLGHFYTRYKNSEGLHRHFGSQLNKLADKGFIRETGRADMKQYQQEGRRSYYLRLFLFVFVPVSAIIIAYFSYQYRVLRQPLVFTVTIANQTPNLYMPLEKASITLVYGDKTETQEVEKEAIFKGIPANFRGKPVIVRFQAEGFIAVEKSLELKENHIVLPVKRSDAYAKIAGIVKEQGTGRRLENVSISVPGAAAATTGREGKFILSIPLKMQRKRQRVRAYKKGYKEWDRIEPVIENEEMIIYMEKRERGDR